MTTREALACPFCGGNPTLLAFTEQDGFVRSYSVHCDECAIEQEAEYESDAIAAWNRRALAAPAAPKDQDSFHSVSDAVVCAVPGDVEIRNNSLGKLDEFFADNVNVHLEQMNDGHWWMGITMPDGAMWHLNFSTKRNAPISCFAERDEPPAPGSQAGTEGRPANEKEAPHPPAQCDGGECGLGGYCDECTKTRDVLVDADPYEQGRADMEQELSSVLPGIWYMDPPDGGSPSVLTQLQRQAKDAARYTWLRNFANFAQVDAMLDATEYNTLDSAVDAAIASQQEPK